MRNGGRTMFPAGGSSLVEVLVSLLLLALGLLGASILQLHSLRARHESALLSAARRLSKNRSSRDPPRNPCSTNPWRCMIA